MGPLRRSARPGMWRAVHLRWWPSTSFRGFSAIPARGAGAPDAEARLAVTAPFLHWPPPPHWHIKQPPGEGPPGLQPAPFPARHGLGLPYTRRPALSYPLPALPLQLFLCRSPVLVTLCSSHRPGTRAEAPRTSVLTSGAPSTSQDQHPDVRRPLCSLTAQGPGPRRPVPAS